MKSTRTPIYVTRPYLPPLVELDQYLRDIWDSRILTNQGKYHQAFERALCDYLEVKYLSLFANGTLALDIALKALNIRDEVITTPFSFIATANVIVNNKAKPVFIDIEQDTYNLDPKCIEAAITNKATAIFPVHVFGHPCLVDKIKTIADQYGLKVIYDAAHAFGVKVDGKSLLNHGNLSVLSFHATKVFNTFEGGAIVCHDEETKEKIDILKNFGIIDETQIVETGINAKMNEFQAALGLVQLKYIDEVIEKRKNIASLYCKMLSDLVGITVLSENNEIRYNYSYFPILIHETICGKSRDYIYQALKGYSIFTRRYFYPLITQLELFRDIDAVKPSRIPVAEKIAEEVLCLPIYPDLKNSEIIYIVQAIKKLIS